MSVELHLGDCLSVMAELPEKRIYKLMDNADLSYRVVIDTECDAIINGEN